MGYTKEERHEYYIKNKAKALAWQMEYNKTHKEHQAKITREYREKAREELFNAYGGKCFCCGETVLEFLTIDHVNGGGGIARKAGEHGGWHLNRKLKKLGYPPEYRLLCYNCNCSRGIYGYCPHEKQNSVAE